MNLKLVLMSVFVAFSVSACAHKGVSTTTEKSEQTCACGKNKEACADNKECPMHKKKEAGCAHCKEGESSEAK